VRGNELLQEDPAVPVRWVKRRARFDLISAKEKIKDEEGKKLTD